MKNKLNPSAPMYYFDATDSTMLEARRLAQSAVNDGKTLASGTVIQAGVQSAGRGRIKGRQWESDPGDSLLFTIVFTKADLSTRMKGLSFTLMPMICGLAVAEAVEHFIHCVETDIQIKWPNDVLAGGRKLCGILCEASGDYLYAGIGINLNQKTFPGGLRRPACSVRMLNSSTEVYSAGELLELVLEQIALTLGQAEWKDNIEQRLYRRGEIVQMRPGLPDDAGYENLQDEISGTLIGINNSGAVIISSEGRDYEVINGELIV